MNMFKKVKAKTVKEYLDAIPKERKEALLFLHNFICKSVPKLGTRVTPILSCLGGG